MGVSTPYNLLDSVPVITRLHMTSHSEGSNGFVRSRWPSSIYQTPKLLKTSTDV